MAYDPCDPCCNTDISFSSNETARRNIGRLLCQILAALGGGSGALTSVDAHIAFGSITTLFTVALANVANLTNTRFYNTTNQPLQISTNGGADFFTVAAGTSYTADFTIATDISVKAVIAPISGELEIYAVS